MSRIPAIKFGFISLIVILSGCGSSEWGSGQPFKSQSCSISLDLMVTLFSLENLPADFELKNWKLELNGSEVFDSCNPSANAFNSMSVLEESRLDIWVFEYSSEWSTLLEDERAYLSFYEMEKCDSEKQMIFVHEVPLEINLRSIGSPDGCAHRTEISDFRFDVQAGEVIPLEEGAF